MISTAVIPKLVAVLANGAFDVYSGRHVRRIVDLAEEVEASVEEGNSKLHVRTLKKPPSLTNSLYLAGLAKDNHSSLRNCDREYRIAAWKIQSLSPRPIILRSRSNTCTKKVFGTPSETSEESFAVEETYQRTVWRGQLAQEPCKQMYP
jgi:hypothetical protein